MKDIGNEHVSYEINMLQYCFKMLENMQGNRKPGDQGTWNALHESFCVHAHNLLKYLPLREFDAGQSFLANGYIEAIEDQVITLDPMRRTTDVSSTSGMGAKFKIAFPHDHKRILELIQDRIESWSK